MQKRTTCLKLLFILTATTATLGLLGPLSAVAQPKLGPEESASKLQLTVNRIGDGVIGVTFENGDNAGVLLNLGSMFASGRVLIPDRLHVIVTKASGSSRQFQWDGDTIAREMSPADYARRDEFIVPLMPTAQYNIIPPLQGPIVSVNRRGPVAANGEEVVTPGDKVQATYDGPAPSRTYQFTESREKPAFPMWTKTVESAPLAYSDHVPESTPLDSLDLVSGLQVVLDRAADGVLIVTFQNDNAAQVLNLGIITGREWVPNRLHFIVTGVSGETGQLTFKDGGGVGGRIDDFLVPLMPAGKYTVTLPLSGLIFRASNGTFLRGENALIAGDKVQAVYEGEATFRANAGGLWNNPGLPIWDGRIESSPLLITPRDWVQEMER